jgi:hypothetical protein
MALSLSDILERESGLRELLDAGEHIGLLVRSSKMKARTHVIDFGSIELDTLKLQNTLPLGDVA